MKKKKKKEKKQVGKGREVKATGGAGWHLFEAVLAQHVPWPQHEQRARSSTAGRVQQVTHSVNRVVSTRKILEGGGFRIPPSSRCKEVGDDGGTKGFRV